MTRPNPIAGSFGLVRTPGIPGALLRYAQALNGDSSDFNHAFLVLDRGQVIEAAPGGARIVPWAKYADRPAGDVVLCDAPVLDEVGRKTRTMGPISLIGYERFLRAAIVREGRSLEGVPYNFIDYAVLALARIGIRPYAVVERMTRPDRLICSQLVDEVYFQAGLHLFRDDRLPFEVTPGDLDKFRLERTITAT